MLTQTAYRIAIGRRIAAARAAKGMTQDQVADLLSVGRKAVTSWESGATMPNADDAGRLASMFGCTVEFLVGRPDQDGESMLVDRRALDLLLSCEALDSDAVARSMRLGIVVNIDVVSVSLREFGAAMDRAYHHLEALRRAAAAPDEA